MASQSGEHNDLNFTGESAEEAQDFIQAVNKRAYAAGRQQDNAWIAEYAYPFFSRKALVWYDTLDEEIQTDWKLLRRAVWAEFTASPPAPAAVPSSAPALVSSPSNPTPAAPPPSAVMVKIGRVRVESEDHTKSGYFYIGTSKYGAIVADPSKANIFEVDTLARTLRFKGSGDSLVIRDFGSSRLSEPGTYTDGCMMKSSADSGTQWNYTWSIAKDGNITATLLNTDGGQCDAAFIVKEPFMNYVIRISPDKGVFLRTNGNNFTSVTLHLEPPS